VKRIGVVAKTDRPEAKTVVPQLTGWLRQRGMEVVVDTETAALVPDPIRSIERSEIPHHVDLLIVLGGDGTLLSMARKVGGLGVPILGVNLGGLGFLTATTLEELYPGLEALFSGEILVEERLMLAASVRRHGERVNESLAFNDVVIMKGAAHRIIDLEVWVDERYATSYRADGLIVSTPTGSTAYSLSAGGPIVYSTMDALVLTPICAHALTNRPIVLPADVRVEVTLMGESEDVAVTMDGQVGVPLKARDVVEVRRFPSRIKLIRFPQKHFFSVLRTKLKWGER
jgi:NAD+ kinase